MIANMLYAIVGALGFGVYLYTMLFVLSLLSHGFDVKETLKDMWL